MTANPYLMIIFYLISNLMCMRTMKRETKTIIRSYSKLNLDIKDIPTDSDLNRYMGALHQVAKFWDAHKDKVDLNAAFGLFLAKVNLKSVISYNDQGEQSDAPSTVGRLVMRKLDDIIASFNSMVEKDSDPVDKQNKLIYTLISNETLWIDRIVQNGKVMTRKQLDADKIYNDWDSYKDAIYNEEYAVPNPNQFDECIASLARSPVNESEYLPTCKLDRICYKVISNGSDFGYALTHRILLLDVARYGRGCVVYSQTADRALINFLCSFAYREATYIAKFKYRAIDLMVEQIMACALEGRLEFLHRTWMHNLLQYQLPNGCFGQVDRKNILRDWQMQKTQDEIPTADGICQSHLSVSAAAVLAITVRNIITSLEETQRESTTRSAVNSILTV